MKYVSSLVVIALALVFVTCAIVVNPNPVNAADAKYKKVLDSGSVPYMEGDYVVIPNLPNGAVITEVVIYDDARGIKPRSLGTVNRFGLDRLAGFNFRWAEANGTSHWQLVCNSTPVGQGLVIDPVTKSKYLRP